MAFCYVKKSLKKYGYNLLLAMRVVLLELLFQLSIYIMEMSELHPKNAMQ
jgi:hypothetical protein